MVCYPPLPQCCSTPIIRLCKGGLRFLLPASFYIHYSTHDTCLTHDHRELHLAEDFEMLRQIRGNMSKITQMQKLGVSWWRATSCATIYQDIYHLIQCTVVASFGLRHRDTLCFAYMLTQMWFWKIASDVWFQNIAFDARLTPARHNMLPASLGVKGPSLSPWLPLIQ